MYGKSGKTVMKYGRGDTIGESDALLGEERDCKATAKEPCVLYEIQCGDLTSLYEKFRSEFDIMRDDAEVKREMHAKKIQKVDKNFGKISDKAAERLKKMYGFQKKPQD